MNAPSASAGETPPPTSSPPFPRPADDEFDAVRAHGAWMPLTQFGLIDVEGEDGASFLHAQLTNDIEQLDDASARLAGYCSPKGRLLASLLAWRSRGAIRLLVAADVRAALQKRLSMFVLRAKAKLVDAGDALAAIGFAGDVREALADLFEALPDGVHVKVDGAVGELIRVPDADGRPRYVWVGPKAEVEARLAALDGKLARVSPAVWDWLDILAGEPRIVAAVADRFVPQMINFEVLGGVNFRKGCYPGQEVVARSQYRGTIKRRMALAQLAPAGAGAVTTVEPAPGVELFHAGDPGQPCGMVVNAAAAPGGGFALLAEIKLATLDGGEVRLGGADGPLLAFDSLPYALPVET